MRKLKNNLVQNLFIFVLFISLLLSFYMFIDVIVFGNKTHANIFSTWQFPMLLALFLDTIYYL
jgi:hypothetical protein